MPRESGGWKQVRVPIRAVAGERPERGGAAEVRVYSPSFHLGQELAPRRGVRLADRGEDQVARTGVGRVAWQLKEGDWLLRPEVTSVADAGCRPEVWVRALRD